MKRAPRTPLSARERATSCLLPRRGTDVARHSLVEHLRSFNLGWLPFVVGWNHATPAVLDRLGVNTPTKTAEDPSTLTRRHGRYVCYSRISPHARTRTQHGHQRSRPSGEVEGGGAGAGWYGQGGRRRRQAGRFRLRRGHQRLREGRQAGGGACETLRGSFFFIVSRGVPRRKSSVERMACGCLCPDATEAEQQQPFVRLSTRS